MDKLYDCTADVLEHISKVQYWIYYFAHMLRGRAQIHDESKLEEPEKSMFDRWTPELKRLEFGSEEYKSALSSMGEALKHHYENNRHHPEHYENGVSGMTLFDLIEMFCDWLAAAQAKKEPVNIDYLSDRFGISPQLMGILINTLNQLDFWNELDNLPVQYFTPEHHKRQVED